MSTPRSFDLLGALPTGTTVLEASAGTGKTFTIAGLVARYVAEGVARLDELLVVTFGRAATQELRDRVRERLVAVRDGLREPAAARAGRDELLAFLARGSDAEVATRQARLAVALASFDAATVATVHEFCQRVLVTLGVAADIDEDAVLVETFDDLVSEVVADLYLRKWGSGDDEPVLTLAEAQSLARTVVGDSQARLVPEPGAADESAAAVRWRFARAVRDEVEIRKRRMRVLGFDDWLTRLRDTLQDRSAGPDAVARLRARYRVVLVDEFQDTDPVQWDILRLAFHGAATLVLIGDPKQAIYAFRGADVHAYLAAVQDADDVATLAQNWRSDPDLLLGLDAMLRGAALGDPRIVVAEVSAAHEGRALETAAAPVQLRVVRKGDRQKLLIKPARELVLRDLVREVVGLLDAAPVLHPRDASPRPLCPGDIAVIVRTNAQLDLVHAALLAAGVPSVQRSTRSVFRTAAAADWIVLLEGLEQPHRAARLRRLAVSPFVGWDALALETGDVDALGLRLRGWLATYEERGVAALFETVSRDENLAARLLGQVEGERLLTDLRHVAEALHAETMSAQLGLTAALEWLRRRVADAVDDAALERSRRLDSDSEAVQLVTVWASKGLEFPVVLVPFDWDRHVSDAAVPLFHVDRTTRVRNVGGRGAPGFAADQARDRSEDLGEDLRLLYVALTRAQAQVVAWWVPSSYNTACAPLHRLLFTDAPADGVPELVRVPGDATAWTQLSALARPGCLSVTEARDETVDGIRWQRADERAGALGAAVLGRAIDTAWRRTSYSALTAAVHDASPVVASEPEVSEKDDEPVTAVVAGDAQELQHVAAPMAALPGGTAFGTLVHAVLERVDPTAADLEDEVSTHTAAQLARFGPDDLDADVLSAALLPGLRTPLGALAGERCLADIAPADRLAELDFELPLAGGDRPARPSRLADLADVLRTQLPPGDSLHAYADQLGGPLLGDALLEGYLAGSIDAVLRVDGRYLVLDYKTNRLGVPDAPLTAWDYRGAALTEAMQQAHYPLQALLYEVALHRFLRWRVAGYDPARHLGGVLYLFLRGMCGPNVRFADGSIPGVFAWQPPAALVVAASDVLAGAAS
jgi:exodeoxyribonuclease V beta subunit